MRRHVSRVADANDNLLTLFDDPLMHGPVGRNACNAASNYLVLKDGVLLVYANQ